MKRLPLVALCMFLLGSGGGAEPPAGQAPVPVDKLVEAFQSNEIRAEMLYTGKEFDLSGRVARVIGSRYGHADLTRGKGVYVVELRTRPLDVSRVAVQCFFNVSERERLAELKAGQEVVIRGTCGRLVVYTSDYKRGEKDYTEVPLRNCKVIEPK